LGLKADAKSVGNFLNRAQLSNFKCKALRAGVWFRVLSRIDRVLVDLTIKVVDDVRSCSLAESILAILKKVELATESVVTRLAKTVGLSLARKLSCLAQRWGNRLASLWAVDVGFARYLAVTHLNSGRQP